MDDDEEDFSGLYIDDSEDGIEDELFMEEEE